MREGGLQIRSDRRLVDDGKRWDALDVVFDAKAILSGREFEGGELQVRSDRRLVDDGKRLDALDVVYHRILRI